jgi:Holliday junction DNA helicase RuvA
MFNSLRGTLTAKLPHSVYLDTGGVEWEIAVPAPALNALPPVGETARLYTWLLHREDAMALFGFASAEDRALFLDLQKVEGVGPKAALKIMSSIPSRQLIRALDDGDLSRLETVSGIGKKTAQKMLLALKGKLTLNAGGGSGSGGNPAATPWQDVVSALVNMGHDRRDCETAVARLAETLNDDAEFSALNRTAQEDFLFRRALRELA